MEHISGIVQRVIADLEQNAVIQTEGEPKLNPAQIGRLIHLVDAYGRHQYLLGQLNMVNTSDRGSAFYELRTDYKKCAKDTKNEIGEIIEMLY